MRSRSIRARGQSRESPTPADAAWPRGGNAPGWMSPVLPFRLKVPGSDVVEGLQVTSTSFRIHGFLQVAGDLLAIEWGGTAHVQDVSALSVRDDKENLPDERLEVPVADL